MRKGHSKTKSGDERRMQSFLPGAGPVAVIDIGTTAARMTIAQIDSKGIHTLEFLQQAVSLGKDTFTSGSIDRSSTEECVLALRKFRQIMDEYGISGRDRIRAVGTTAIREAANKDAFLDRVYIATGIQVEVLDEADMTRLTYLGIQPHIKANPALMNSPVLVVEVGGGNTEILVLHKGNIILSGTYRLGALRMRETMETFGAAVVHRRDLMEGNIDRTVRQILQGIPSRGKMGLIALGGDARFAAGHILHTKDQDAAAELSVKAFQSLTEEVLALSVDEIERKYHLSFQEAETVGPALLIYSSIAKALDLTSITVAGVTMRHGILTEMSGDRFWIEDCRKKALLAAMEVARKFHADEAHATHVARLCKEIFADLAGEHGVTPHQEFLLHMAALLHDVGLFISSRTHHKHSMYLIQNSEIFGVSRKDIQVVSLIARYHRRASPKSTHPEYMLLDRESRLTVSKLAAILRVADALDVSHSQRIMNVSCRREKDRFVISIPDVDDFSLEQMGLKQKGSMFEEVYGSGVVLRRHQAR